MLILVVGFYATDAAEISTEEGLGLELPKVTPMTFKPRHGRRIMKSPMGVAFGRMLKRMGRNSGQPDLAKAGQDLLQRSYGSFADTNDDLASPSDPLALRPSPPQPASKLSSLAPSGSRR